MASAPPTYSLNVGELIVCREPAVISTVLGSCVSVTLFSPKYGVGGMIHYALPNVLGEVSPEESFRYGELAIAGLVAELTSVTGGDVQDLQAKVIGGAQEADMVVGSANAELAFKMLERLRIPITGRSVGGSVGRKVLFHTSTGRLQVAMLSSADSRQPFPVPAITEATAANMDFTYLLAIGASTGGTQAITKVLRALPERIPPTVIVQHIHPTFSEPFAERLNQLCPFEVKEARDGDEVKASRVLLAPGGKQMRLYRRPDGVFARVTDDPPVNRHKPSVDYLFNSVATVMGSKAVGVILTGMGSDGASGLKRMRDHGAFTVGQDEKSSVVFGMARVAYEYGAVEMLAPLEDIAPLVVRALQKRRSAA